MKKKPAKRIKKFKKPAQNDSPLIAFVSLFVLGILLVLIVVFNKTLIALIPHTGNTTYQQDFISGKKVIWYDETGIFMYKDESKNSQALVNFPLIQTFSNPLLSPDNTKIAYLVQITNYPNAKFELRLYDLKNNKHTVLVDDFKSSSEHPYTWAKDSRSLFVILLTKDKHTLFRITLEGHKTQLAPDYQGEVYANLSGPDVINDAFVAFSTCDTACEKKVGIINLKKNKTFFVDTPKEADTTKLLHLDDSHALQVNIYELPRAQAADVQQSDNNKIIVGLEKISLTTQKRESVPLPKDMVLFTDQRIQAAGICGNAVLVGLVGVREREGYQEEYYTRYFLYDIYKQTLTRFAESWGCNRQGHIYATSSTIHEPLAITKIDLANITDGKEIKYSQLLSEEILAEVRKGCLGIGMLSTGSTSGNDFVYIDVGTYMETPDVSLCDSAVVEKLSGIYRLSSAEKSVKKLNAGYPSFHRFFVIEPNP